MTQVDVMMQQNAARVGCPQVFLLPHDWGIKEG